MTTPFQTPFGDFTLQCDNATDPSIQAWNQADCYLLNLFAQHDFSDNDKLAVVNDDWGALALGTAQFQPEIYSDSAIFSYWLGINCKKDKPLVQPIENISNSTANIILMRLPKNLHFFRHQLSLLSFLPDITLYIAGMQKYWPASFFEATHDYFADVEIFPGVKKAKAICLKRGKSNPEPATTTVLELPEFHLKTVNYPNVFSRENLDIGTRFFLENFPDLNYCHTVLDLACGNGLLGIQALKQHPELQGWFVDESWYATQSCRDSLKANDIKENRYEVTQNNILHNLPLPPMDAILCNPPFHQQHRIGDHIASVMIKQSKNALKKGGCLYLIGNRHLNYQLLLRQSFKHVEIYASNNKFLIFKSIQ